MLDIFCSHQIKIEPASQRRREKERKRVKSNHWHVKSSLSQWKRTNERKHKNIIMSVGCCNHNTYLRIVNKSCWTQFSKECAKCGGHEVIQTEERERERSSVCARLWKKARIWGKNNKRHIKATRERIAKQQNILSHTHTYVAEHYQHRY